MSKSWHDVLDAHAPLLLPAAHDALAARLIRRAGFPAYQIGGLALEAARAGVPDVDLVRPGEMVPWVSEILRATDLPALVDASNGGGDMSQGTKPLGRHRHFSNVTSKPRTSPSRRIQSLLAGMETRSIPNPCHS